VGACSIHIARPVLSQLIPILIIRTYFLTGWTTGVRFLAEPVKGFLLFTIASRLAVGLTQPPIQCVPGALSLGMKRPRRESDHSPPSIAEVKMCVSNYTCTLQYVFMAWCLVKHRDNFTLYFAFTCILVSWSSKWCKALSSVEWMSE